jgi:hypothetical protein
MTTGRALRIIADASARVMTRVEAMDHLEGVVGAEALYKMLDALEEESNRAPRAQSRADWALDMMGPHKREG